MFTRPAADAKERLYFGQPQTAGYWHGPHRFGGAFFGANRACGARSQHQAFGSFKMHHADPSSLLLGEIEQSDRAARADLPATPAIEFTGTGAEIKVRLRYPTEAIFPEGWLQYIGWAGADTKLAADASRQETIDAHRPWRGNGPEQTVLLAAFQRLVVRFLGSGQLRASNRSHDCDRSGGNKRSALRIGHGVRHRLFCRIDWRRKRCGTVAGIPFPGKTVLDRMIFADAEAVAAGDASRIVDGAVAKVDALGLTGAQAFTAFAAGAPVDRDAKRRPAGEQSEKRSNRADRVAVEPPPEGSKYDDQGKDRRRKRDHSETAPG